MSRDRVTEQHRLEHHGGHGRLVCSTKLYEDGHLFFEYVKGGQVRKSEIKTNPTAFFVGMLALAVGSLGTR